MLSLVILYVAGHVLPCRVCNSVVLQHVLTSWSYFRLTDAVTSLCAPVGAAGGDTDTDCGLSAITFPSADYSVTASHFLSNPHRLAAVRTCWKTRSRLWRRSCKSACRWESSILQLSAHQEIFFFLLANIVVTEARSECFLVILLEWFFSVLNYGAFIVCNPHISPS